MPSGGVEGGRRNGGLGAAAADASALGAGTGAEAIAFRGQLGGEGGGGFGPLLCRIWTANRDWSAIARTLAGGSGGGVAVCGAAGSTASPIGPS